LRLNEIGEVLRLKLGSAVNISPSCVSNAGTLITAFPVQQRK